MKKFMRIALVFALAGATLVGCTKDYSGDISDLNKKVTEQASTLSALQTQVGAAQTAADAAAQKAAEALAEAQKKASSADVQAAEERVNAKINDLVNGDVKALKDAVAALEGIKADERLTDLETAIKDFVTKAEFAQELAALKDELTAAIAAGDKANADAIAALEKKVEDILAQSAQLVSLDIVGPTTINVGYATFKGVFENVKGKWTASTWDGSREVPAKGTLVSSANNGTLKFKVNPTDYVLAGEDLEIINEEGVVAPFVFSDPVAATKTNAGFYESTFSTRPDLDEDELNDYKDAFKQGTKVALAAKNVVSNFSKTVSFTPTNTGSTVTFKFDCCAEYNDGTPDPGVVDINKEMPETITVVPATGEAALYDAYISGVGSKVDSIKYGLSYDGMTFSYDAEAVKEAIVARTGKSGADELKFKVTVTYINNSGYIYQDKSAEIKFKQYSKANPEQEIHDEFVLSTAATYQAKVLKSNATWGEKVTVDITEALKEWGLDDENSDARILWNAATNKSYSIVEAYSYDANDPNVTIDQSDLFEVDANFAVDSKKKTQNVTITFDDEYGDPNEEFDPIVKGGTVYVKVELANATDKYYVVIPVEISAIKPADYFTWNGTNNYADGVLTIYPDNETGDYALGKAFKSAAGYGLQLNNNSFDTETGEAAIQISGQSTKDYEDFIEQHPDATESDLETAYETLYIPALSEVAMQGTSLKYDDDEEDWVWKKHAETDPTAAAIWWNKPIKEENYNHTMTITGLTITIYGRTFKLGNLDFQFFKKIVTFSTDPAEIVVAPETTTKLYNAALAPSFGQTSQFAGSFSLKYGNKALAFNPDIAGTNHFANNVSLKIEVKNEEGLYDDVTTTGVAGIAGVNFTKYNYGWNAEAWGIEIIGGAAQFAAGKTYELKLTLTQVTSDEDKFVTYADGTAVNGVDTVVAEVKVTVKN